MLLLLVTLGPLRSSMRRILYCCLVVLMLKNAATLGVQEVKFFKLHPQHFTRQRATPQSRGQRCLLLFVYDGSGVTAWAEISTIQRGEEKWRD